MYASPEEMQVAVGASTWKIWELVQISYKHWNWSIKANRQLRDKWIILDHETTFIKKAIRGKAKQQMIYFLERQQEVTKGIKKALPKVTNWS